MDWYEPEVQELEARRARRPKTALQPNVFYGSSSIRLWQTLSADLACPSLLNLGFGGSTLAACAYFYDRLVLPENPKSLVLYAGDNDLGDGQTSDEVLGSFDQILKKNLASLPGVPFGFISIKPSPARCDILELIRETNTTIKERLSGKGDAIYYVDVFESMLNASGQPRAELFDSDGLHMNRKGYRLWKELLQPYRQRFCPAR